jgi:hypothetical protein
MEKIEQSNGCWLWTAACFSNGYAAFRVGPKQKRAHRWAYEHFIRPITDDEAVVMHVCDVKRCVNPAHLRLGTPLENQRDMTRKGRGRTGDRNGWRKHAPKLSHALADEIRARYASGGITQAELASEYGVTQTMIGRIARGTAWKR